MAYRALILIVCSANLCRSPMAEHLFRRRIDEAEDDERLRVASAGTWADADEPSPANAQQVMLEEGIDLSAHRSRALTQPDVDDADLILVMTRDAQGGHPVALCARRGQALAAERDGGQALRYRGPLRRFGGALPETKEELEAVLAQGYERIARLALGLEVRPPEAALQAVLSRRASCTVT